MSDDEPESKDEHGEPFKDFGFLRRVEALKSAGNAKFKKDSYGKALKEYESALELLQAISQDKAIILSEKKMKDIVTLRSTIHLNRSTCYYKLKNWQKSVEEASKCLAGDDLEELKCNDPYLGGKVEHLDRKLGYINVAYVEHRLPKATQAKAWFRMSRCYVNLGYSDRAKQATTKARKACQACNDKQLLTEISQHWKHINILEKKQRERQQKQFEGYFDKLGAQGGYMSKKMSNKARWDKLSYAQKLKHFEKLDGSDGDSDSDFEGTNDAVTAPVKGQFLQYQDKAAGKGVEDPPGYSASDVWARREAEREFRAAEWHRQKQQRLLDEMEPGELQKKRREQTKRERKALRDDSSNEDYDEE